MPYRSKRARNRALRNRRRQIKRTREGLAEIFYESLGGAIETWLVAAPLDNLLEPNEVLPVTATALAEHLRRVVVQMREDGLPVPKPLLPLLRASAFMERPM